MGVLSRLRGSYNRFYIYIYPRRRFVSNILKPKTQCQRQQMNKLIGDWDDKWWLGMCLSWKKRVATDSFHAENNITLKAYKIHKRRIWNTLQKGKQINRYTSLAFFHGDLTDSLLCNLQFSDKKQWTSTKLHTPPSGALNKAWPLRPKHSYSSSLTPVFGYSPISHQTNKIIWKFSFFFFPFFYPSTFLDFFKSFFPPF